MQPASRGRSEYEGLAAALVEQLEPVRRALAQGPRAVDAARLRPTIERLLIYVPAAGHPANLYAQTGLPRTHNAWEMQYVVDGGLLFGLYARCRAAVRAAGTAARSRSRGSSPSSIRAIPSNCWYMPANIMH